MDENKTIKNKRQACVLWGSVITICAIAFMATFLYLLDCVRVTDDIRLGIKDVYLNVMKEEKGSFRDTDSFYNLFFSDTQTIARNLAVSQQFEEKNEYAGDRKIDIVSYYYRRDPKKIPAQYQNLHIEYRLRDLLAWYSMDWYEQGKEQWLATHPAFSEEGRMEASAKDDAAETVDAAEAVDEDVSENIEMQEVGRDPWAEEEIDENAGPRYGVIVEEYYPVDGISLYERSYDAGMDVFLEGRQEIPSLRQILWNDIEELQSNETIYEKGQAFMNADQNLKYVLLDPNGRIIKSNLRLESNILHTEMKERTRLLKEAFSSQKTYLLYTYGTLQTEAGKTGHYIKKEFTDALSYYDYICPEGSELLLCVLDEGKDQKILGSYKSTDLYGKADAQFHKVLTTGYVCLMAVCFFVAALAFIIFTVFVPAMEKEKVRGFHKVPTIVAAFLMFVLGACCITPPLALLDGYGDRMLPGGEYAIVFVPVLLACTFFGILAFLYGWYSLILRIKSKTFFSDSLIAVLFLRKNSLLKRLVKGAFALIKKVADFFSVQQTVMVGTILPYVGFLMLNAMIVVASRMSGFGIFLCFLLDLAVGVYLYFAKASRRKIDEGIERIINGDLGYQIDTERMFKGDKKTAEAVNQMGDTITSAVERSMADERMKTELITNVSHDIKTPLTSVINYVDLLKREDIKSERAREYIRILDEKSQRLKVLIFDLVEASKISSGNITLQNSKLDMCELISQSLGEFEDRFQDRNLSVVYQKPEQSMYVWADPARMWRVFENLLGNVSKYAMPGSRVYIQAEQTPEDKVALTIKNMSETPLNVSEQELMERFVRGDEARSSEGSGLGLSIARDLVKLMKGELSVHLDGDLFKVSVEMPKMEQEPEPVSVVTPEEAAPEDTKETPSEEAKPEDEAEKQKTQEKPDPDAQTE